MSKIFMSKNWKLLKKEILPLKLKIIEIPYKKNYPKIIYFLVESQAEGKPYYQVIQFDKNRFECACIDCQEFGNNNCNHIKQVKKTLDGKKTQNFLAIQELFRIPNLESINKEEIEKEFRIQDSLNRSHFYQVIQLKGFKYRCACGFKQCNHIKDAKQYYINYVKKLKLQITHIIEDYQVLDDSKIKGLYNIQDREIPNFFFMVIETNLDEWYCACGGDEEGNACHHIEQALNRPITFEVNQFLQLRFKSKNTQIYVYNPESLIFENFSQCKYLLLNFDFQKQQHKQINEEIDSIDEAVERLSNDMHGNTASRFKIPPKTEFWGHCSNLQAWFESGYDTRLLHRNLAFPLLKKLYEAGDPLAKKVFKDEIFYRIESGYPNVIIYLRNQGYISKDLFSKEELEDINKIIKNVKK